MLPRQPCHTCNNNKLKYYWHVPTSAYQKGVQGIYQGQGITKEHKKVIFIHVKARKLGQMSKGVVGNLHTLYRRMYSYRGTRPRPVKEHFNYLLYKQFFWDLKKHSFDPFYFLYTYKHWQIISIFVALYVPYPWTLMASDECKSQNEYCRGSCFVIIIF